MSTIIRVWHDLAKTVFLGHGVDGAGQAVPGKKLMRDQVLGFFSQMPPCVVAMEACGGAHFWASESEIWAMMCGSSRPPRVGDDETHAREAPGTFG